MTPHILDGTPADADEIGAFQTTCWDQAYRGRLDDAFLDATTAEMRAARWRARIESGERRVLLARSGGRLLGVASTSRSAPTEEGLPDLELNTLYVDERAWGTGVAAALLRAAIGGEPARLLVFSFNARARSFYAKHGFRATGRVLVDAETGAEEQLWVREAGAGSDVTGRSGGPPRTR